MIYLSAGHYPESPGACHNDFCEYDEAAKWVVLLQKLLQPRTTVLMVPADKLTAKVAFINKTPTKPGDLAIEIHFNSDVSKKQHGSETLYCPGSVKGERAALIVQNALSSLLGPNRGAKEGWYQMDKPGHKDYPGDVEGDEVPDYFLAKTNCVALILEPEFIYNRLAIESLRDVVCEVLADAIIEAANAVNK